MTLKANPLPDLCLTYGTRVRNICVQSSDLPNLQVVLKWRTCFLVLCAPFFSHFHNCCTHPATARVPLFCSLYPFSHCTMLYCPNPSCTRNCRNTKKPFPCAKSFSNHVQMSPVCKPFVFDQTAVSAPTMQAPSTRASTHTTAHLFKKQRLRLNPTFTQQ